MLTTTSVDRSPKQNDVDMHRAQMDRKEREKALVFIAISGFLISKCSARAVVLKIVVVKPGLGSQCCLQAGSLVWEKGEHNEIQGIAYKN